MRLTNRKKNIADCVPIFKIALKLSNKLSLWKLNLNKKTSILESGLLKSKLTPKQNHITLDGIESYETTYDDLKEALYTKFSASNLELGLKLFHTPCRDVQSKTGHE